MILEREISIMSVDTMAPPVDCDLDAADPRASRDIETAELWHFMATLDDGDPQRHRSRNRLVELHQSLARHLAFRYRNRGEPMDDLFQVAMVALINSVDRFDPSRGLAFGTFATPTILGELKRHFRDKGAIVRIPRPLQELKARMASARADLDQQLGRSPTIAELAAHLDIDEELVLDALEANNAYSAVSLDTSRNDDDPVGSAIERKLGILDDGFDLIERRQAVMPLLDALSERDRRIIFLRFFREKTQSEIAAELGLSQMHVSRLLTRILGQLHARLAIADQLAS
jgi:RNA polymerase sigma-B factor